MCEIAPTAERSESRGMVEEAICRSSLCALVRVMLRAGKMLARVPGPFELSGIDVNVDANDN